MRDTLGTFEGELEADELGMSLGASLGVSDNEKVGEVLRDTLGRFEGESEGDELGMSLGMSLHVPHPRELTVRVPRG